MTTLWKAKPVLVAATVFLSWAASVAVADQPANSSNAQADEAAAAGENVQSYDLSWWSVDGGGGSSSDGSFTLTGAVGQPEVASSSAGGTALTGGVWAVPETVEALLFSDGFEDGDTNAWDGVSP